MKIRTEFLTIGAIVCAVLALVSVMFLREEHATASLFVGFVVLRSFAYALKQ